MSEELKQVTAFLAGMGSVDMRTKMPHDEIVKEMRGDSDDAHATEAIFVGVDEVDNNVHIHLQRHNILGYVIRPFVKRLVQGNPGPGGMSLM